MKNDFTAVFERDCRHHIAHGAEHATDVGQVRARKKHCGMTTRSRAGLLLASIALSLCACGPQSPTAPGPVVSLSQFQLGYRLLAVYPDYFWCDPDFYPIAREGQEQQNAINQLSAIRAVAAEFSAILEQLKLADRATYRDAETLSIYREHKKLTGALQMTSASNGFDFVVRTGQGQGLRIDGTITSAGKIAERSRQTSFNTCPI